MSQTQNSSENLGVKAKLQQIDKLLEDYIEKHGLKFTNIPNIKEYLNITSEELKSMNEEECGIAAFELERYAMYIQLLYNKEKSRAKWANSNLKLVISESIQQYEYCSSEQKEYLAIRENEYAYKLHLLRNNAELRALRLHTMGVRASNLANYMADLQQTKRMRGGRHQNG